jgi:hypothetical protein
VAGLPSAGPRACMACGLVGLAAQSGGQVPDLRLLGFGERQLNNLLGTDTRKVEQALARMTA